LRSSRPSITASSRSPKGPATDDGPQKRPHSWFRCKRHVCTESADRDELRSCSVAETPPMPSERQRTHGRRCPHPPATSKRARVVRRAPVVSRCVGVLHHLPDALNSRRPTAAIGGRLRRQPAGASRGGRAVDDRGRPRAPLTMVIAKPTSVLDRVKTPALGPGSRSLITVRRS
jgi:hypothetical protein